MQSVLVSGKYSDPAHLRYGVPQGSVLGPALFSDYSSPVASLIRSFNIIARVRFWAVQNLFWAGRCPKLGLNPPFTAQNCPKLPKTTQNCLKIAN